MSIRAAIAILLLVVFCFWTLRRPFVGVCLVVSLFHLNLRVLGAGLEEIRFQFITTIVLLISYFLNREELNSELTVTQTPMKWLFAFLGATFLTSLWAAGDAALAFDSAIEFSKIVLFAWLMTKIVRTEKEVRILMYVVFAGMFYVSFMSQWGVEWDWIDETEVGVATGGAGCHLMMFVPLMILLAIYGNWKEKIATIAIMPFVLNFLPNTTSGSRSTLVMLVTSMAFLFIFAPGSMRFKAAGPILIAGAMFVFFLTPPSYWEDMATILDPTQEGSANSRFIINDATFEIIQDYPLGIGYNNYAEISMKYLPEEVLTELGTRDAHNSYLKVMAEFGVAGFVVWMVTFLMAWLYFRKIRKTMQHGQKPSMLQLYALAFELGLIGISVGIYTHSYNDLDTLYWFVAFSGILFNIHRQQLKETPAESGEPSLPQKVLARFNGAGKTVIKKTATPSRSPSPLSTKLAG